MRRSIRVHTRTGRPLGSENFIENLEAVTGQAWTKTSQVEKQIILFWYLEKIGKLFPDYQENKYLWVQYYQF